MCDMTYDPSETKDNQRVYIHEWVNPRSKGKRALYSSWNLSIVSGEIDSVGSGVAFGLSLYSSWNSSIVSGEIDSVAYKHYLQCDGV